MGGAAKSHCERDMYTGTGTYCGHLCKHCLFFFLFMKADNPIATALCDHTENGTIQLQNVTVGNCNENLQTLEKQVCHMVYVAMGN